MQNKEFAEILQIIFEAKRKIIVDVDKKIV
jgi:hypothetical protein